MAMQLSQSMRTEMRQLLTPRMIQSMEILQLPLMALEERIEQELQNNPVLEQREGSDDGEQNDADGEPTATATIDVPTRDRDLPEAQQQFTEEETPMVVRDNDSQAEDFDRLAKLADYLENEEWGADNYRSHSSQFDGERDKKQDAMSNTAARGESLAEYLLGQWAFAECSEGVRRAGEAIINHLEDTGYLKTSFETIQVESKTPLSIEDLYAALAMVQELEPSGIAARTPEECLILQLNALENEGGEMAEGHDFALERGLVAHHLKDLEMNRYPLIARKLECPIDAIKTAVKSLARLSPHPGREIGGEPPPSITPDATVFFDEETGKYAIRMTRDYGSNLYISGLYRKMLKEKTVDRKTREFLSNNVRNARWLLESIEQRSSTIQRVIRAVVDAQQEFFEKGPESLKPLPMIGVADQLGIHVATVSRAVSEKWIQTPRGIYPLRRFFSGGTQNSEGEDMSWDAVKEKLRIIIDHEDKMAPLSDDDIVLKLKEQGIELARRTVAKYRKILNIPTARQRREY